MLRHPDAPRFWRECGLRAMRMAGLPYTSLAPAQWSLVLSSKNIPFQLVRQRGMTLLFVPPLRAEQALGEILAFLREPPLKAHSPTKPLTDFRAIFIALSVLSCWHALRMGCWGGLGQSPEQWLAQGALNIAELLEGEWFRLITALTMHADVQHLLGNCIFGGIALCVLAMRVGALNALSLSFYTGAAGNLVAALLRSGASYSSIGASTAMFGTMGILCGLSVGLRDRSGWRGVFFPLAAGLAWLAFLGTEGKRVDILAHITGLVCGGLIGLAVPKLWPGARIPGRAVFVLAGLMLSGLAASWLAAWNS
ncbi:MAG: rhomboid family intramembrane serine protease [Desulfovibrionaceae bacterium]|nr:rhomboid family intramembrane serine protease [Desulfovibrionaceae bacterium]